MNADFPYDHPAWDTTTDAYSKTDAGTRLARLAGHWDDEEADDLFYSSLLHQDTVYPATFLALPHAAALAGTAPEHARPVIAGFLAGVALAAQTRSTSGGVSLAEEEPWAETALGREASRVFRAALPDIARICAANYRVEPSHYLASGVAAALGHVSLAHLLASGEGGAVPCAGCDELHEWLVVGGRVAIYRGRCALEDWKAGRPDHAASVVVPGEMRPEAREVADRLGPLDDITAPLLASYGASVPCAACGERLPY